MKTAVDRLKQGNKEAKGYQRWEISKDCNIYRVAAKDFQNETVNETLFLHTICAFG